MFSKLISALAIVATAIAAPVRYDGHKVFRITPRDAHEVDILQSLKEERANQLDWWLDPSKPGRAVDVRVSPSEIEDISTFLSRSHLDWRIMIDDVQAATEKLNLNPLAADDWHSNYHDYDSTVVWLKGLESSYPSLAKVVEIGTSYENRIIYGIQITGASSSSSNKPQIALDGAIHAREWIAPATVDYIASTLLTQYSNDTAIKNLVDNIVWTIVPIFNVDGYAYTFSDDRMWRKTRQPNQGSSCVGTDPCRNAPTGWGLEGSSDDPCADDYHGPQAESEPEVRALLKFYLSLSNLRGYINFHSYSQLWMNPYGYQAQYPPANDYNRQEKVAGDAVNALTALYGTQYTYGPAYTTIYPAAGIPSDHLYVVGNVTYAYAVELRDTGANGFLLPPDQIIPCGEEVFAGVRVMAEAILAEEQQ